jgi:thiol-disulfide isomerase/thioredoxin
MKKLFLLLSLLPLFFACNDSSSDSSYKITGQVSSNSMNGQTVYLENYLWYMQLSDRKILDSAVINGKQFEFKGKADSSYMALITLNNNHLTTVFIETGNIKVDISDDPNKSVVTGTKLNNLFKSYGEMIAPIKNKLDELIQYARSQKVTDELQNEIEEKYNDITKEMLQVSINFLNKNPETIFSAYLLMSIIAQGIDEEIIQNAYDKFDEKVKHSALGNQIRKEIEKMKVKEIATGELFRDLTLKTPDDKDISISDYVGKNKYVLLDFWASWCGPCRSENPNIVSLYNEYKDKGFEIVGVSMDSDKNSWIKGIKDDGITWPQMSDLKGWDSEAAMKYKIRGIPFTVLLDKEGKVIDTNLRGEQLIDKIKTLIP